MKEVSGRACRVLARLAQGGESQADARGASTNTPTTRVRERAARFPILPRVERPTASLRAMGPEDLPSLLAGSAEVVPAGELERSWPRTAPAGQARAGPDRAGRDARWAVVLHKLRQFQDAGHTAVLIVGDFTARVGDPSGKSETGRAVQGGGARVRRAAAGSVWMILDPSAPRSGTTPSGSSRWTWRAILRLTASTTVARMLERDDFAKRYRRASRSRSWSSSTRCSRGRTRSRSRRTSSSAAGTRRSTCSWAGTCSASTDRSRRWR